MLSKAGQSFFFEIRIYIKMLIYCRARETAELRDRLDKETRY